jgi:hypothetical protein
MNKAFGGALVIAVSAGLAATSVGSAAVHREAQGDVPQTAARALKSYLGGFQGVGAGSRIRINASFRHGEAKKVESMHYTVRMNCEQSGPTTIGSSGWQFDPNGIKVRADRRFSVSGGNNATPRSTLTFKGRFSRNFARVKGTFKTKQWFDAEDALPAEYCTLPTTVYTAKR